MAETSSNPSTNPITLAAEELRKMHAYWRACNYLAVRG